VTGFLLDSMVLWCRYSVDVSSSLVVLGREDWVKSHILADVSFDAEARRSWFAGDHATAFTISLCSVNNPISLDLNHFAFPCPNLRAEDRISDRSCFVGDADLTGVEEAGMFKFFPSSVFRRRPATDLTFSTKSSSSFVGCLFFLEAGLGERVMAVDSSEFRRDFRLVTGSSLRLEGPAAGVSSESDWTSGREVGGLMRRVGNGLEGLATADGMLDGQWCGRKR